MGKYKKKTDWICKDCESINDVYARKCCCCGRKKDGAERRL